MIDWHQGQRGYSPDFTLHLQWYHNGSESIYEIIRGNEQGKDEILYLRIADHAWQKELEKESADFR